MSKVMFEQYWVVGGKPNGEFNVPTKSKRWQRIVKASDSELQAAFPHMRGQARKELAFTKGMRDRISLKFNADGEFVTDDEMEARYAEHAAKSFRKEGAGLHKYSLPFTSTVPLFTKEEDEDEDEDDDDTADIMPAARRGGRPRKIDSAPKDE